MRRVVQEGQNPRPLQEKATSISSPHELQRTRAKPLARMPQARYPLELMTTKPGRPAVASLLHLGKKGLQMGADRLVQHRPLGFAASIPWAGRGARRYRLCL